MDGKQAAQAVIDAPAGATPIARCSICMTSSSMPARHRCPRHGLLRSVDRLRLGMPYSNSRRPAGEWFTAGIANRKAYISLYSMGDAMAGTSSRRWPTGSRA